VEETHRIAEIGLLRFDRYALNASLRTVSRFGNLDSNFDFYSAMENVRNIFLLFNHITEAGNAAFPASIRFEA